MKTVLWSLTSLVVCGLIAYGALSMMGAGGFKRMVTLTGVYAVCKPGGYDVVCFLDADSKQGGLSCLPLVTASLNGECKK